MKVKDLVKALQSIPQELEVFRVVDDLYSRYEKTELTDFHVTNLRREEGSTIYFTEADEYDKYRTQVFLCLGIGK